MPAITRLAIASTSEVETPAVVVTETPPGLDPGVPETGGVGVTPLGGVLNVR